MDERSTVRDQLQCLYQTILSKARGYCGTEELLRDFYDDYQIDGQVLAKEAGFSSFKDLLGSKEMQNKIQNEINYLGQTVYKGRDDPRIRHIRSEPRKSVRNQEGIHASGTQQHLDMAQKNNAPPRVVTSNQNSQGRSGAFFDFDDEDDDNGCGPVQSTSTGIVRENNAKRSSGAVGALKSVKKIDNMWEIDDDDEEGEELAAPTGSSQICPVSVTAKLEKQEQINKQKWTAKGEGEFTDSTVSDDDGDNAAILPSLSKESKKIDLLKQPASKFSRVPDAQSFYNEPEIQTASNSNPFTISTSSHEPRSKIAAVPPVAHGQKWIEAAANLRKESMAKESRKDTFETSSFTDYQRPSQIEKNRLLKDRADNGAVADKNPEPDRAFRPVTSAIAPRAEPSSTIDRGMDFPVRRSDSVASIMTNAASRRISKPLTEEDLGKVGEVINAIVKYTYPRTVLGSVQNDKGAERKSCFRHHMWK